MNVLVTGATGFIGRNLIESLDEHEHTIYAVSSKTSLNDLEEVIRRSDFIYHLAAVHRPHDEREFEEINVGYFGHVLYLLRALKHPIPVMLMSSIQAGNGSPYGNSKCRAENMLLEYGLQCGQPTYILRLTNTFGKYARPNSHSVVATFAYNISHGLPIHVNDPDTHIKLCYVDAVTERMRMYLAGNKQSVFEHMPEKDITDTSVGDLAGDLYCMRDGRFGWSDRYHMDLKRTYDWFADRP